MLECRPSHNVTHSIALIHFVILLWSWKQWWWRWYESIADVFWQKLILNMCLFIILYTADSLSMPLEKVSFWKFLLLISRISNNVLKRSGLDSNQRKYHLFPRYEGKEKSEMEEVFGHNRTWLTTLVSAKPQKTYFSVRMMEIVIVMVVMMKLWIMTMMMVMVTKEIGLSLLEKTLTLKYNLRRRKFLSLERDILPGLSCRWRENQNMFLKLIGKQSTFESYGTYIGWVGEDCGDIRRFDIVDHHVRIGCHVKQLMTCKVNFYHFSSSCFCLWMMRSGRSKIQIVTRIKIKNRKSKKSWCGGGWEGLRGDPRSWGGPRWRSWWR